MDFKLIGSPCGHHGPYTFYKAFKYTKHGKCNILALSEFFFVKLWNDSDLVSIGELQLLWEDKNSEQTLASLRLYILPENTPDGRSDCHGEHEVLAITEKVVLRVEDLLTWITDAADWSWGLSAVFDQTAKLMPRPALLSDNSFIDLAEVDKEKGLLGESHWDTKSGVVVLSFPRYCRYRGMLKRLEGVHNKWLREGLVVALGGFSVPCRNTRVLFCKDTFDYPDLEGHELLCNHLAPKLKGRPRKKRKVLDISPDSSDSESEASSVSSSSSSTKAKTPPPRQAPQVRYLSGSRRAFRQPTTSSEESDFLTRLHSFMRSRQSPINRVPTIGFKELDLFRLYSKVRHLGGYDTVSASRLWKYVYEEMGGDQSSTSAATCCRRHYERLLLPFERHQTPSRSKNPALAKLNKYQEISITAKLPYNHDKSKNLPIKNGQSKPPVEKENIPQSRSLAPDVIDLTSDHSPVKSRPNEVVDLVSESDDSPSPVKKRQQIKLTSKKQTLEILREGGLEVTAIPGMTNGRLVPPEKPRPSVIQHVPPNAGKQKVSITVTPDVAHILPNNRHSWSQPVYGNPKEPVHAGSRHSSTDEILDLRTKCPYSPVGSNLEITLIPQASSISQNRGKKSSLSVPNPAKMSQQQRPYQPPVLKVPSPVVNLSNGRGSNIVPSVSISVNNKRKSRVTASTLTSHNFPTFKPGSYSFMDPVYLSALYGGLFSPFTPGVTTPQQLQVYKELIHRQNIPDSFPRLLQDGSTSISLVNQNATTPTSK